MARGRRSRAAAKVNAANRKLAAEEKSLGKISNIVATALVSTHESGLLEKVLKDMETAPEEEGHDGTGSSSTEIEATPPPLRVVEKKVSERAVRRILHRYGEGLQVGMEKDLSDEDDRLMRRVLQSHPNRAEKEGAGVVRIVAKSSELGTCFAARRADGSVADFAWRSCFKNEHRGDLQAKMANKQNQPEEVPATMPELPASLQLTQIKSPVFPGDFNNFENDTALGFLAQPKYVYLSTALSWPDQTPDQPRTLQGPVPGGDDSAESGKGGKSGKVAAAKGSSKGVGKGGGKKGDETGAEKGTSKGGDKAAEKGSSKGDKGGKKGGKKGGNEAAFEEGRKGGKLGKAAGKAAGKGDGKSHNLSDTLPEAAITGNARSKRSAMRALKQQQESYAWSTYGSAAPTAGAMAGNEILGMLQRDGRSFRRAGGKGQHFDPKPLSKDEFLLVSLESREDAAVGADRHNLDTFGESAAPGGGAWDFDSMLEANRSLAPSPEIIARRKQIQTGFDNKPVIYQ